MGRGLRGLWTAALSLLLLYAVYLGFASLTVLVLALDSKGSVDPLLAGQGGWLLTLLSLGVPVKFYSVLIGIPALLATGLDLLVLAALVRRRPASLPGFCLGLVLWTAAILLISLRSGLDLAQGLPQVGLRAAAVFVVGYLWGACSTLAGKLRRRTVTNSLQGVSFILRQSLRCLAAIGLTFTAEAMLLLVIWSFQNHQAMGKVFAMTGMPLGSAVITTVLSLFWLPNFALWALSWVLGAGFHLGSLGSFSLWSGTAHDLPPVPVFGLFPAAVPAEPTRVFLLVLPVLIGLGIGLIRLILPSGFHYFQKPRSRSGGGQAQHESSSPTFLELLIVKAVYPLAGFCLASVLLVFLSAAAFALSNGSLGSGNLASVGVDVTASTQALARPVFAGLLIAWLLALVAFCLWRGIRISRQAQAPNTRLQPADLLPLDALDGEVRPVTAEESPEPGPNQDQPYN